MKRQDKQYDEAAALAKHPNFLGDFFNAGGKLIGAGLLLMIVMGGAIIALIIYFLIKAGKDPERAIDLAGKGADVYAKTKGR
ncbi:hypothetical protein BKI52_02655 [marine bacterium AO1-C]|nr:hypothetical protein BKI52_02655 [marine bacterium AO1-C]